MLYSAQSVGRAGRYSQSGQIREELFWLRKEVDQLKQLLRKTGGRAGGGAAKGTGGADAPVR